MLHFHLLQKHKLFAFLFAQTATSLQSVNNNVIASMLHHGFNNTDQRISIGKPIIPAFLYAVLLWWPMQEQAAIIRRDGKTTEIAAMQRAMQHVLHLQKKQTLISQKLLFTIKEIWILQHQLAHGKKRRIHCILAHPRFRAAYDFLLLRAQAGEQIKELADWWTQIQTEKHHIGEPCQVT